MGKEQDSQLMLPARAPLRWAGSKRKSVSALKELLPDSFSRYVEPFAGSACLAFAAPCKSVTLGDINPQLIEFYSFLRSDPDGLHEIYMSFGRTPETYYRVREEYNSAKPSLERAARFLYLNRHCFNGIYRVNSKGNFNVPWGGDKVGNPLSRDDLNAASACIQNAELKCDDFESVIRQSVRRDTLFYLDPPYARNEQRVFREYHENSFATFDWRRFLDTLRWIDDGGGYFLVSYAGDPNLISELTHWNIGHLDVTRNVGGFRSSRRKHREFIATNFEAKQ